VDNLVVYQLENHQVNLVRNQQVFLLRILQRYRQSHQVQYRLEDLVVHQQLNLQDNLQDNLFLNQLVYHQ
jgi:hypothetical protein